MMLYRKIKSQRNHIVYYIILKKRTSKCTLGIELRYVSPIFLPSASITQPMYDNRF